MLELMFSLVGTLVGAATVQEKPFLVLEQFHEHRAAVPAVWKQNRSCAIAHAWNIRASSKRVVHGNQRVPPWPGCDLPLVRWRRGGGGGGVVGGRVRELFRRCGREVCRCRLRRRGPAANPAVATAVPLP